MSTESKTLIPVFSLQRPLGQSQSNSVSTCWWSVNYPRRLQWSRSAPCWVPGKQLYLNKTSLCLSWECWVISLSHIANTPAAANRDFWLVDEYSKPFVTVAAIILILCARLMLLYQTQAGPTPSEETLNGPQQVWPDCSFCFCFYSLWNNEGSPDGETVQMKNWAKQTLCKTHQMAAKFTERNQTQKCVSEYNKRWLPLMVHTHTPDCGKVSGEEAHSCEIKLLMLK